MIQSRSAGQIQPSVRHFMLRLWRASSLPSLTVF
jgi:hypothetical protein